MADDASRSCLTSGFVIPGFLLRLETMFIKMVRIGIRRDPRRGV